jgi:pilus assembly protein CpaB
MASKFGKHYPVLARQNERERLLFVAAAGLAFSLLIILFVVFNFKQNSASANVAVAPDAPQVPVPPMSTVTLLTPERPVRAGAAMSTIRLKEVYWPRNQVPEGAILDLSEAQNMTAKVNLTPGVPIQRDHLTSEYIEPILDVSPGNRAVTIAVDEVTSIESHARPGSRVDVALTYYHKQELTSKIIVQNARVISLGGQTSTSRAPGVATGNSRTITLDVAPKDALEIQTAKKLGTLSLMMRHHEDARPVAEDEIDQNAISGDRPDSRGRQKSKCKKGTVRINGNEFVMNCDGSLSRISDPYEP